MAITFISKSSVNSVEGGDQVTVTAPPGIQNNDVLVGTANAEGQPLFVIWATPSGFTLIDSNNDTTGRDRSHGIWYKIANNESGNYTFELEGSTTGHNRSAGIVVYRGVDISNILDVSYNEVNHYSNFENEPLPTPDSITTVTDGALVIVTSAIVPTIITSGGAPSGYNLRIDEKAVSNLHLADKIVSNAGLESPGAWTHSGGNVSDESSTFTIALRPATDEVLVPYDGTVPPSLSGSG